MVGKGWRDLRARWGHLSAPCAELRSRSSRVKRAFQRKCGGVAGGRPSREEALLGDVAREHSSDDSGGLEFSPRKAVTVATPCLLHPSEPSQGLVTPRLGTHPFCPSGSCCVVWPQPEPSARREVRGAAGSGTGRGAHWPLAVRPFGCQVSSWDVPGESSEEAQPLGPARGCGPRVRFCLELVQRRPLPPRLPDPGPGGHRALLLALVPALSGLCTWGTPCLGSPAFEQDDL